MLFVLFIQSESKLSSCQQTIDKLQKMVVDAETRADAASTQVGYRYLLKSTGSCLGYLWCAQYDLISNLLCLLKVACVHPN
jgi:hypothetical protein